VWLSRQFLALAWCGLFLYVGSHASDASWRRLSSASDQLPVPGNGKVQTAIAVGDFDKNRTNDFVLGFADAAPALVLISKGASWTSTSVELEGLPIAPGGIAVDVDRDDDLDLIFGTSRGEIYWWENPYPDFDPTKSWARHVIKNAEGGPIWGEAIGDFMANGDPQLVFWNQANSTLYAATIPREVRTNFTWPFFPVFTPNSSRTFRARGLSAADVNIDGQTDLIAANYWLKLNEQRKFKPTQIDEPDGIILTGRFNEGTYPKS